MRLPDRRATLLFVALWLLLLGALPAAGQTLPRLLEDIKVLEVGGQEALEFHFSSPYEAVPVEEHGKGAFSLTFSGTGSRVPVRQFRAPGSKIINNIKVVQNKYSTTVSLTLKDPNASMQDRLAFQRDGKVLRVAVGVPGGQAPVAAGAEQGKSLLSQMTQTIAGAGAQSAGGEQAPTAGGAEAAPESAASGGTGQPAALGHYQGVEWLPAMLTLGLSLLAIVVGLYFLVFLYNRFFGARVTRMGGGYPIKLLSSFHLGPKQRIVVLDVNGEVVACGVTPTQISFLTRLGGGAAGQRRAAPGRPQRPAPAARPAAAATAQQAAPAAAPSKAIPAEAAPKADPVQQFAEALKEKVSSLKRIK